MESDTPIELLVSRVWNGTKWHYPNIERMVEENKRLRAELAAAKKRIAELEAPIRNPLSSALQLEEALRHEKKDGGGA